MTLRVRLEIVPHGDEEKAYEIGRLDIFNMGRGIGGFHVYGCIEMTPESGALHDEPVRHHRNSGAWKLVSSCLKDLGIEGP